MGRGGKLRPCIGVGNPVSSIERKLNGPVVSARIFRSTIETVSFDVGETSADGKGESVGVTGSIVHME